MLAPLRFVARHGRWCLVLGLLAGLFLPGLARAVRPFLPELIAGLLFLSALRIGPQAAWGGIADIRRTLGLVVLFQCAAPLVALASVSVFGLGAAPLALAIVLLLAAPSVTGSPNFTILLGHDPSAAMRLLLIGTALFPLTVLPILAFAPGLGTAGDVFRGAFRLLVVIAGSVGLAFGLRLLMRKTLLSEHREALDGASAIVLGVVVVGLMTAVGPTLANEPLRLAFWLAAAFGVNFGLQGVAFFLLRGFSHLRDLCAQSVVAGNRNIALFLVALPADKIDPILLFIGCYQVPMYLTPILLRRLYGSAP